MALFFLVSAIEKTVLTHIRSPSSVLRPRRDGFCEAAVLSRFGRGRINSFI